ncbi:uncharacterized protein EKO05_0004417 [Ascochyta rabiei]|uniref:uncharacterized protein n=1 Tax=Didymella rabiei TaxID=5454 RepID=UPI0018FF5D2A|nr:uncharacterized protein EKO05_0004417 [Ascochyta rabiei]UPX13922.1 hypothetical protein EKO05_0004417 [Ascochyta rabiei]
MSDECSVSVSVKGILRKPTEKFPEEPGPVREGIARRESQPEGKEIPTGARWTKIDRRLVNPEALEEAEERFEECQDYNIVLRILTKQEIQKLADRTHTIREQREEARLKARDAREQADDAALDSPDQSKTDSARSKST